MLILYLYKGPCFVIFYSYFFLCMGGEVALTALRKRKGVEGKESLIDDGKDEVRECRGNEEKEKVKEDNIDGGDEYIEAIAWKILVVFICVLVVVGLSLYFYWGYLISKRFTMYLFSRDAWNFDIWPFNQMKRPVEFERRHRRSH